MVEYYNEEQPPSCKVTIAVFVIVLFLSERLMLIGIGLSMRISNTGLGLILTVAFASIFFIPIMFWIGKRWERWMVHKLRRKLEKEAQEHEERRWR